MAKRQSFSLDDAAVNTEAPKKKDPFTEKKQSGDSKTIKRLTLDMPSSLHRRLKLKAIEDDIPMAEMVREWIEQRLT